MTQEQEFVKELKKLCNEFYNIQDELQQECVENLKEFGCKVIISYIGCNVMRKEPLRGYIIADDRIFDEWSM